MDLIELERFTTDTEAHIIAAAMRDAGFHPTVSQAGLAALLGAGTSVVPVRILIPEAERDDAVVWLAVTKEKIAMGTGDSGPEKCPECGEGWELEFEACWNCSYELN